MARLAEIISETNWIKRCDLISYELSIERDEAEQLKEFAVKLDIKYKTLKEHFSLYNYIKKQWPDQEIDEVSCAFSAAAQLRRFQKRFPNISSEYKRRVFIGEVPYRTVKAEADMVLGEGRSAPRKAYTSHQGTAAQFRRKFKETISDELIQGDQEDFNIEFNQRLDILPISVDVVCTYKSMLSIAFKLQSPNSSLSVSEEINRVGVLSILKRNFDIVFQIFPENMVQNAMNVSDYIDALELEDVFVMVDLREEGLTLRSSEETDEVTLREIIFKKTAK